MWPVWDGVRPVWDGMFPALYTVYGTEGLRSVTPTSKQLEKPHGPCLGVLLGVTLTRASGGQDRASNVQGVPLGVSCDSLTHEQQGACSMASTASSHHAYTAEGEMSIWELRCPAARVKRAAMRCVS